MSDTPESDSAWEYSWDEGGCHPDHLLEVMKKLERQRAELLEALEQALEEYRESGAISNETWENAEWAIAKSKGASHG